jgi:uncharacterized membrane protein
MHKNLSATVRRLKKQHLRLFDIAWQRLKNHQLRDVSFLAIIGIQFSIFILICLDNFGFNVPVIREICGFVYLTFIPGLLILRILKLDKLDFVEKVLFSVGLSVALVMMIGALVNFVLPIFGVTKPLDSISLLLAFSSIVFILIAVDLKNNRLKKNLRSSDHVFPAFDSTLQLFLLFALLIVLTILSTSLAYSYGNDVLAISLYLAFILLLLLVVFDKIPRFWYPTLLFATSLGVLLSISLLSPDILPGDTTTDFFVQKQVLINAIWNPNFAFITGGEANANTMLSVTTLGPVYSLITGLSEVWVFKLVYVFLFSLVPLALFEICRKQTSEKISYLAAFLFIAFPAFIIEMNTLIKQETAELFVALFLLILINKQIEQTKRTALLIVFAISIIVSHYSTTYIFLAFLVIGVLIIKAWNWQFPYKRKLKSMKATYQQAEARQNAIASGNNKKHDTYRNVNLNATLALLFFVFCVLWYLFVFSGDVFSFTTIIGRNIYLNLRSDVLVGGRDYATTAMLGFQGLRSNDLQWQLARFFNQIAIIFTVLGVLYLFIKRRQMAFHFEYEALGFASFVVTCIFVILPYFTLNFGVERVFQFALLFLAPFCVLGGVAFFDFFAKTTKRVRNDRAQRLGIILFVLLFLMPYFLFNSGVIFGLTGSTQSSRVLSANSQDWGLFSDSDISGSQWLANNLKGSYNIYSDYSDLLYKDFGYEHIIRLIQNDTYKIPSSYVFFRQWNTLHDEATVTTIVENQTISQTVELNNPVFSNAMNNKSEIYSNGAVKIYY